ncbi:hypothetical protein Tco_0945792 [Tanacetum coccineum]
MESQSTQTIKIPILQPGEYDLWKMRMEQCLQCIDYSLWEIIENESYYTGSRISSCLQLLLCALRFLLSVFRQQVHHTTCDLGNKSCFQPEPSQMSNHTVFSLIWIRVLSAKGQYAVLIIQNTPYCLEEQIRHLDCRSQYVVLRGNVNTSYKIFKIPTGGYGVSVDLSEHDT